jgi:uncharacterized membrane protein YeaQ/YmgE (transglycosylase-associated protein family)
MSITLPGIDIGSHTLSVDLGSSDFLVLLLVGLIAGLLAARVVGVGGGVILDMIVGIIGAFLGRWLFGYFNVNLGPGLIPMIIEAFVGACLLLLLVRAIHGGYRRRSV